MKAAVEMDMFGCPNRCRHCWLGHSRNPHVPVEDFNWVVEQFKNHTTGSMRLHDELIVSSWYREPDYADQYKELWDLDKRLSTTRFLRGERELASIWRLVRDGDYAPWLKSLGVDCVQISLFGMEQNTDHFTGRRGAFRDCIRAIEVLLNNGIAPRIQLFPFKTNLQDFGSLERILSRLRLEERVQDLGREFACFLNASVSPVGEGFDLERIRINREELLRLPPYFIEKTLKHVKAESIEMLWPTEAELLPSLLADDSPLNDSPQITAFMVASDFNVYPNCGEIADWWRLGNLKTDGIEVVMDTFLGRRNPGLRMNYEVPVRYFAEKYGDRDGDKLWTRGDLVQKWIRLEALAPS